MPIYRWVFSVVTAGFLIMPVVAVIVLSLTSDEHLRMASQSISFRWYREVLTSVRWRQAALESVIIAATATCLATALGLPAAISLTGASTGFRAVLVFALTLPIVVPLISQAVSDYAMFATLQLVDTRTAVVLAHTALAVPIFVLNVWASLQRVDPTLSQAARTLGAGPFRAFVRVTLPLIRPGIVTGAVLAFVTSFDESVLAIFLAGTSVVTLPKRMWEGLQFSVDPSVAAVGSILVLAAGLTSLLILRYTDVTH
jgi:putative spermidine/putrescine transport system permease protein